MSKLVDHLNIHVKALHLNITWMSRLYFTHDFFLHIANILIIEVLKSRYVNNKEMRKNTTVNNICYMTFTGEHTSRVNL